MAPDPAEPSDESLTDFSADFSADIALEVDALLSQLFTEPTAPPATERSDLLGLLAAFGPGTAFDPDFEVGRGEVVFDADGDPALVGVRAAGVLEGQQLVVEAGELTVVLDVVALDPEGDATDDDTTDDDTTDDDTTGGGSARSVRGEVLGTDEVLSVQLLDGVVEVALAVTDALGEFTFDRVPPGTYELIVSGGRREVSATVTVH